MDRLAQQIKFIIEIDRLKGILRQNLLADGSRRENSAEHSWHLAMMAVVLAEYAPAGVDLLAAAKMLLLHDLVEIDAGDTFCYDAQGNADKGRREQEAAVRLFRSLPESQGMELKALWEEFEAGQTSTAFFAVALDRLQPFLLNAANGGEIWQQNRITRDRVLERLRPIATALPTLWPWVQQAIEDNFKGAIAPQIRDLKESKS